MPPQTFWWGHTMGAGDTRSVPGPSNVELFSRETGPADIRPEPAAVSQMHNDAVVLLCLGERMAGVR